MLDYLARPVARLSTRVRHRQFSLTKQLGAPIDFLWPCTNSGNADGVAFIKVTELGLTLWDGPPFTVPPNQTVPLALHQTIDLSLGLHSLVAELHEGLPLTGSRLIASDTVALTVVSNPILTPVGQPTINGVVGPTLVSVVGGNIVPISWAVQNTGGGAGQARLQTTEGGGGVIQPVRGSLLTIPANTTMTLLLAITTSDLFAFKGTFSITLTMRDEQDVILGSWQFILVVV